MFSLRIPYRAHVLAYHLAAPRPPVIVRPLDALGRVVDEPAAKEERVDVGFGDQIKVGIWQKSGVGVSLGLGSHSSPISSWT